MPRLRDREEVALLQSRSLNYACGDKRRAVSMLINAAKALIASGDLNADKRWADKVLTNLSAVGRPDT